MFSLMPEEYFVEIVNAAISRGLSPDSPNWPIAGLQHWGGDAQASTMSNGPSLRIRAMVLLRIKLNGLHGESHEMVVRMRIVRRGSAGAWRGMIVTRRHWDWGTKRV